MQQDDDDTLDGLWPKPSLAPASSDELPLRHKLARAAMNYPFVTTPLIKLLEEEIGPRPTRAECNEILDMGRDLYYKDEINRDAAEAIAFEVGLVGIDELVLYLQAEVIQSRVRAAARELVKHWHLYRP